MVVYSEDTEDLFDEGNDEEEDVTLKVKSYKFKSKKHNFDDDAVITTLQSKIEQLKDLTNGLAKKQESMEYMLMKKMHNRLKKAQQKDETKEKAK